MERLSTLMIVSFMLVRWKMEKKFCFNSKLFTKTVRAKSMKNAYKTFVRKYPRLSIKRVVSKSPIYKSNFYKYTIEYEKS